MTGLLFQVQMSAHMNPKEATWEIRSGVSNGNGGTVVASGTAAATMKPTGRVFIGLGEYSVGVKFPAVSLSSGTYWVNVTPQCTDSSDGQCTSFATRYFVSNTVKEADNVHGSWQPVGQMFLNSSFFGFDFINWCDPSLGLDSPVRRSVLWRDWNAGVKIHLPLRKSEWPEETSQSSKLFNTEPRDSLGVLCFCEG